MVEQERFHQGQDNIEALVFPDSGEIKVGRDAAKISVVFENGQMAGVPWFAVWKNGRMVSKWNGAELQGVVFGKVEKKSIDDDA